LKEKRNLEIGYVKTILEVLLEISDGERCHLGLAKKFEDLGQVCRTKM
jgi:hypothetical protein